MKRITFLLLSLLVLMAPAQAAPAVESFWVAHPNGSSYMRIEADLVSDGRFARIWLDSRDRERVGPEVVDLIARALDSETPAGSRDPGRGIIENVRAVFGDSPTRYRVSGKEDILLLDLVDQIEGMTTLGYFQTKDQYSTRRMRFSNERNIIYIDSREGLRNLDRLIGTIAHEYQHLVHFGRNPEGEVFFNEGCSELASVLVGYSHSNSHYLADPNVPLLRWNMEDPDGAEIDYERAMSLLVYLYEQYGDRFVNEFVGSTRQGVARIDDALERSGHRAGGAGWRDVLLSFAIANVMQQDGEGAFGYRRVLDPAGADAASFTIGPVSAGASSAERTLAPYGASYHLFDHPGDLRLEVDGAGDFTAAALVQSDAGTRIVRLGQGEEVRLGEAETRIEKVVLVLVSFSGRRVDARWSARTDGGPAVAASGISSPNDRALSLVEITPNPVASNGRVVFTTAEAGELRLEVFTGSGDRVGTIAENVEVEPGRYQIGFDASPLTPGIYLVRLQVGGRAIAGRMVVRR